MRPGLGVVPDLRVVKRDFSKKSAPCELAQRVVDRAKGWGEVERARLVVESLRGEMPVACTEDCAGESEAWTRGPDTRGLEPAADEKVGYRFLRSVGLHQTG